MRLLLLILLLLTPAWSQNSHIDGNAPDPAAFDTLLERDLKTYFEAESVDFEFLRRAPTQSGVSLPKYYLWVRARLADGSTAEGAVRVAAIEKTQFEVTHFVARNEIESTAIEKIFPQALLPAIRKRAK